MPHLLIADDERYQRLLLREILASDPSLTFSEAEGGAQALQLARIERPDLVLLDVMMPIMDGLETCRLFKSDPVLRTIPVLLVTAWRFKSLDDKAWQAAGADGIVSKPFEESELQAKVRDLLRLNDT